MCTSQLAYASHKEHVASGLYSKSEVNKNIFIDSYVLHSTSTDQGVSLDVNAY